MLNSIEEYVNQFDGTKREWIEEYTAYMKEKHPEIEGVIWFRMPTYKMDCYYIAFACTKHYFAVHTNDSECFDLLKIGLDNSVFGKRSAKIRYSDDQAKHVVYNTIEFFVHKFQKDNRVPNTLINGEVIGFPG